MTVLSIIKGTGGKPANVSEFIVSELILNPKIPRA
jgi:hypothetical protein